MIILIVFGVLLVVAAGSYNSFVSRRNVVDEGWSGIDVQLKRRFDLIPNLIETVKGYASHEKSTLEEVITLRNSASAATTPEVRASAEQALSAGIGKIFALAEAYPDLKANENFKQLQIELSAIEDQIQFARRFYNGAVRDYNTAIQTFPGVLIAGITGFTARAFFEIEDQQQRATPAVKFN